MTSKNHLTVRCTLFLTFICSSVIAEENPIDYRYYVLGQVGQAYGEVGASEMNQRMAALGFDADASVSGQDRTAWQLGFGYHWNDNIDLEFCYTDLGRVRTRLTGNIADITAYLQGANAAHPRTGSGYEFALVANWPLKETWGVFARAAWLKADTDYLAMGNGQTERRSQDEDMGVLGVGVYYHVHQRTTLRLNFNRYPIEGEKIPVIGLSVIYRFGESNN